MNNEIPQIPLSRWVAWFIEGLQWLISDFTRLMSEWISAGVKALTGGLMEPPVVLVVAVVIGIVIWHLTGDKWRSFVTAAKIAGLWLLQSLPELGAERYLVAIERHYRDLPKTDRPPPNEVLEWIAAGQLSQPLGLVALVLGVILIWRVTEKPVAALVTGVLTGLGLYLAFYTPPESIYGWCELSLPWFEGSWNPLAFLLHAWYPQMVSLLMLVILCWWVSAKRGLVVFAVLGLLYIWNQDLWEPAMQTLSLVFVSTLIAISLGIPLGILASVSKSFELVIKPILDFMQTLPAFVYLIPAIFFFGTGRTAAIIATVIFSMPPAIRLTLLGIQQVPADLVEAADAFGTTKGQKLIKLQLPLALPSIQAGVNQTVLLALSMVVIAAMIGAKGLGSEVWKAIQRLLIGSGFVNGIAIVILAILLDRTLQTVSGTPGEKGKH